MDEIAKTMADFRRQLRLEGFTESEALHLTGIYLSTLLSGAMVQQGAGAVGAAGR